MGGEKESLLGRVREKVLSARERARARARERERERARVRKREHARARERERALEKASARRRERARAREISTGPAAASRLPFTHSYFVDYSAYPPFLESPNLTPHTANP